MNCKSMSLAVSLALLCASSRADTSAGFSVDWRGLPNVEGILKDSTKATYGFANFVAFGPGWQYTAQDYAAKRHSKEPIVDARFGKGLLFTGRIWAGKTELAIREEFYDVSADGRAKAHVRWTVSNVKDAPMALERAYVRFPLSRAEFAGGKVGGTALPVDYGGEWIGIDDGSRIEISSADGTKRLSVSVIAGKAVMQDARKDRQDRFELRIEFPRAKEANSSTIEFEVSGSFADSLKRGGGKVRLDIPPPPTKVVPGEEWCVFPYANEIKEGSILDFSSIVVREAPAGKYGFPIVTASGHLAFERAPERNVRFVGGNLCFDANFLSKDECRRVVSDFVRRGWNTVRFHHIDVTITKDEWKDLWGRQTYPEISPARLDQLDCLLAECKKAGIYVTFDLYAMGCLGSCEGFDKPLNSNTVKAVVPIHKPAEDLWFRRAMEILDHVNPYTGLKWKDDPAVLFVTLMNEDSIASVWWGAAEMYVKKYNEWAAARGYPQHQAKGIGQKREFAEFLHVVKAEANRRMGRRLREAGVKTLVSGGNWWDTMAQAYEREALDVVDNHGYGDHPQPSYQKLPFHVNQTSDAKAGNPAYSEPMMKAPSRILGKPFAVTEYNFCPPNRHRAGGGLLMGAYASLQDWDALYRFAWSHSREALFGTHEVKGFDIVRDPIGQLTERQVVLLFGRGDVAPARRTYGYGVTREEAMGKGLGDMWARGLFPHPFTQLGYTSRIGSFTADGGRGSALPCERTFSAADRKDLPKFNPDRTVSDTGEITISTREGDLAVSTPRTAAVASVDRHDLAAGPLSVTGATASYSVSASAMDAEDVVRARKVLILHLTDVLNSDMTFSNDRMTDLKSWGRLPYLARCGEAKVSLRNANGGLKVFALASDGSRLREVPAAYADGAYTFLAKVAPGEGADAPTMIYELGS